MLVGHNYAGMVITGVAATVPERLRSLIYLDAYVPEEGQTEVDLWPPAMRAEIENSDDAAGGLRPPPTPAFLGINDPKMAEWVKARITPHPMAAYTQPAPAGDARSASVPRAYISCMLGPATPVFGPFAAKAKAAGWEVREIAAGHALMLTAAEELARVLLQIADQRG